MFKAITVCVDYSDLLAITLPYNRHHFDFFCVVTAPQDERTIQFCRDNGTVDLLHVTDKFYEHGAVFNKWAALEQALDHYGRDGWMCLMDADVLWPKVAPLPFESGKLYTPRRRMMPDVTSTVPDESTWSAFPIHPQEREWAGYTQVFSAFDDVLGPAPWHETNWAHAGGADSFFQAKWSPADKVRPKWNVLHLGEAGVNWCGRSSGYVDGSMPVDGDKKREQTRKFIRGRVGKSGTDRFSHEKID